MIYTHTITHIHTFAHMHMGLLFDLTCRMLIFFLRTHISVVAAAAAAAVAIAVLCGSLSVTLTCMYAHLISIHLLNI